LLARRVRRPDRLQNVQVAIDALVIPDVLPFWRAVLGYEQLTTRT
jgi:4a-hydroxytetrahydrobiopterin dehydratase